MPNMGFRGIYAAANSALGGRITAGDLIPSLRSGSFPSYLIGGDPYFNYTTFLLKAVGANTSQNYTFLDSSTNNLSITRNGDVMQGAFTPYSVEDGYWSNYFDGTGDYLLTTTSDLLAFGTGDYTVEFWVYGLSFSSSPYIYSSTKGVSTWWPRYAIQVDASGTLNLYSRDSTGESTQSTSGTLLVNKWHHIAVSRSGGTTKAFLDGTQVYSGFKANDNINVNQRLELGAAYAFNSNYFNGYISNLRVIKGEALYVSNFTTPKTKLTNVSSTSFLACQSNYLKDNSTNNFAITRGGDVKITSFQPFNLPLSYSANTVGGGIYFDGSSDYFSISGNEAFLFSENFTIEFWIYPTSTSTSSYYIMNLGGSSYFAINITPNSNIQLYLNSTTISATFSDVNPKVNLWNHVALVRNSGIVKVYVNGIASSTTVTNSSTLGSSTVTLNVPGTSAAANYMSDIRVVKSAVYVSNFTPPTEPLTAISGTSLLLNGTNAGIVDGSRKNTFYILGDAQVRTDIVKFDKSIYFDGTGDYLTVPSNTSAFYNLSTGDFTIETWCYQPNINSGTRVLSALSPYAAGNSGYAFYLNAGYAAWFVGGSNRIVSTNPVTASEWTHIAVVRSSGITKMYFNGVQTGSSYTDSTNYSGTFYVGSDTTQHYLGYMEDFRVTRYARYTENFTPPSGPLLTR